MQFWNQKENISFIISMIKDMIDEFGHRTPQSVIFISIVNPAQDFAPLSQ